MVFSLDAAFVGTGLRADFTDSGGSAFAAAQAVAALALLSLDVAVGAAGSTLVARQPYEYL